MGRIVPSQSLTVNGRIYRRLQRPLVVVCLDGSSVDYIRAACERGVAPYLSSLIARGNLRISHAVMPTFTNPNNLSIVTGVAPSHHGISGNFFLDRTSGQAVMMNDASLLRAETLPAAFSQVGAKVIVITAKEKLRKLLGYGLDGLCFSAEEKGQPVYSSMLSEYVLERGAKLMQSERPDLVYLSTSDYIQHLYPPGSTEANQFYAQFDVVFFSFWLSHIPTWRIDAFWRTVRGALKPGGSAFFIDSLFEPTSTAVDHLTPDRSGTAHRRLNDGREFRIVKVFHEPAILERQLIETGWQGWVRSSGNFFLYGNMTPV